MLRLYRIAPVRLDFHELKKDYYGNLSINKNSNWFNMKDKTILLNNFKTDGKYGTKKYHLDDTTFELLKEYCDSQKISTGYIFPELMDKENLKSTKFSNYFRGIIKKELDIDIDVSLTVSDLRAAFVTHAWRVYPNETHVLSLDERQEIASQMCHTIDTAEETYLRRASLEKVPYPEHV